MTTRNTIPDRTIRDSNENANKENAHKIIEEPIVYSDDFGGDYHVEQDDETEEDDFEKLKTIARN